MVKILNQKTGGRWKGGGFPLDLAELEDAIRGISADGSWAALIGPRGRGHWVVVDGLDLQNRVCLRDPSGHRRRLSLPDFGKIWAPGYIGVLEVP